MKQVAELIAKGHDPEKFSKLIAELNPLLDGLTKSFSKPTSSE